MIITALLIIGNGVFADDMERGIRPFVQFVGIVADKEYTMQCTDADLSSVDLSTDVPTIKEKECTTDACPILTFTAGTTITVTNFPALASGSSYECNIANVKYEVIIGVIEAPSPYVSNPDGTDTYDEETESPIALASCITGYAQPAPTVEWLDSDGNVVYTCDDSNVDEFNTDMCLKDQADSENPHRHSVELALVANVKKGQGNQYICKVTYYEAENGEKVPRTFSARFPEEGCIRVAGSSCDGEAAPATDATVTVKQAGADTAARSGEEAPDVKEKPEAEEEEEDEPESAQLHNALLGTATGIVIFAIIVILIWFIRKKSADSEESEAQYKAGESSNAQQEEA